MKSLFFSWIFITSFATSSFAKSQVNKNNENNEFKKYLALATYLGTPAKPIIDTKGKRKYRTTVKDAATVAADFNGHYKLFSWGCGMNCIGWGMLNQKTGTVWMPPEKELSSCWAYNQSEADHDKKTPNYFEYSIDSSLLYVYSCDDTTGRYIFNIRKVYVWKKDKPILLRTERVTY